MSATGLFAFMGELIIAIATAVGAWYAPLWWIKALYIIASIAASVLAVKIFVNEVWP